MRLENFAVLLATMCTPAQSPRPVPADPSPSEPAPADPRPSEPAPADPALTEAAPAELSAPEPTATVCDASPVRRQILQALFADQEFRDYVCDEPCSEQAFADEVVLRQELLSQQATTWGCFAEPKRQATTGLFAVFLVQNEVADWHMSHSGIYIGTKRGHFTNGYADLEATEREYPATWLTHHLVWNGKTYVVKSTEVAR